MGFNDRYEADSAAKNSSEKFSTSDPKEKDRIYYDWDEIHESVIEEIGGHLEHPEKINNKQSDYLAKLQCELFDINRRTAGDKLILPCPGDKDYFSEEIISEPRTFYELVFRALKENGMHVVEDPHSQWCGLGLYNPDTLKDVQGLKVPGGFMLLRDFPPSKQAKLITCLKDAIFGYLAFPKYRYNLLGEFSYLKHSWEQFIDPLVSPVADFRRKPLYAQVLLEVSHRDPTKHEDPLVAPMLKDYPFKVVKSRHPMRVIPGHNWFPEAIQKNLKAHHIVAILPDIELQVFMLFVGRTLIGPSGTIPIRSEKAIEHTSRIACILLGPSGNGKTELLKFFRKNLPIFGYTCTPFTSFSDRFGLGEPAKADLAFKDDTSEDELQDLTKSSMFKSFAVSSPILADKKHKDAVPMCPKAASLLCANTWKPTGAYNTDEGNRSRLRLLLTKETGFRDRQLEEDKVTKNPDHPWHGASSLTPDYLIPHLASKYKVSESVIMAWLFRLSADFFYENIPNLEQKDKYLESRLTVRIQAEPTKGLAKVLKFSLAMANEDYTKEPTKELICQALHNFVYILLDDRSGPLMDAIKDHWNNEYRSQTHTWTLFSIISYISVIDACIVAHDALRSYNKRGNEYTRNGFLTLVLSNLATNNTLSVGQSPSNFYSGWNSPDSTGEVKTLYELTKDLLPPDVFTKPGDLYKWEDHPHWKWYKTDMNPAQIKQARKQANQKNNTK